MFVRDYMFIKPPRVTGRIIVFGPFPPPSRRRRRLRRRRSANTFQLSGKIPEFLQTTHG